MKKLSSRKPLTQNVLLSSVLLLAVSLTACQTTLSAKTECAAFKPIYWHKVDTDKTKQQIGAHNAVYREICK